MSFGALIADGVLVIGDGYRAKNSELGGEGPIFLRAGQVRDTHIEFDAADRFIGELTPKLETKMSRAGDVVVTTKGNSIGRVTFINDGMPPFIYSPHLSYWRSLDHRALHPGFLRYWSRSREFRTQLRGFAAQTDMAPFISLRDQQRLSITLPPPEVQQAIAETLGALDDKIDLNRRMNRILESIARAIFKSWFVDFDPVCMKMDGKEGGEVGLPPPLAAMPPTAVQQAAEVVYGAPFKSDMFNSSRIGRPLLRIRDLATHDPGVYTTERHPREAVVKPGEVVVGMDGEFRAHLWQGPSSLLNQRMCLFRPVSGVPRAYVLESLREPLDLVERSKTGTTVIHLSKADIDGFRFPPSSREVLDSFASATEPVLDAVVRNAAEAKVLAAVRDELLPRLLSGGGDRR